MKEQDYDFLNLKIRMRFKDEDFKKTKFYPDSYKLFLSGTGREERLLPLVHEIVHRELMGTSLGLLYMSVTKIYELLVDRFCARLQTEVERYCGEHRQGHKLTVRSTKFLLKHMDDIIKYLGRKKDIAEYCAFCVSFRRRCQLLLDNTKLVQEGTAAWVSVHFDYEKELSKKTTPKFQKLLETEKLRYQDRQAVEAVYYEGYQIADALAKKFGGDSLTQLALVSLDPPVLDLDVMGCTDQEFYSALSNRLNSDLHWKRLLQFDPELIRNYLDKPELYEVWLYRDLHGAEPDLLTDVLYFDDKRIIEAINKFENREFIHTSLKEYYDSEDNPSLRPMSYVTSSKYVLKSRSLEDLFRRIVFYHKITHGFSRHWDKEWTRKDSSPYFTDADENIMIHLENMTNFMEQIISFAEEDPG